MNITHRSTSRLGVAFFLAAFGAACSSVSSDPSDTSSSSAPAADPAAASAATRPNSGPASSPADLALVADAKAFPEMRAKAVSLEKSGWTGGDFDTALIERNPKGDSVSVRFVHQVTPGTVDVVYTFDEAGGHMVMMRPLDAASRQLLTGDAEADQDQPDSMSEHDLGELQPEIDLAAVDQPAKTEAALACGHLSPGQTLHSGEKLWSCKNGYALFMQSDGNLVLYAPGSRATWSSRTNGKGGYRATMQADGNFVVYNKSNKALWASGHRRAGDKLDIQNDGNLVKTNGSSVSWSTGTYCESGCVGVCKEWSCDYKSKVGAHPSCFTLPDNPLGLYRVETHRWGRTVPGFCGTGLYAESNGDGIECPTSHVVSQFLCDE